ncbi:2',5'-phosphodiesterase 12 [Tetrabaena socialis]|uniref:2',5'-phosphodiesterase 12 n=1 Tax=Tetrabaena socialis TaxID=47790 RepID=A0A2J8A1W4_9CHLO|nr:2',5'-phosphodiesterase 12 [Tetrabaena socialis]|eukprot:PNH06494.1 2',5'-phosphodiesterase 12 [Tetrabaena socialis]
MPEKLRRDCQAARTARPVLDARYGGSGYSGHYTNKQGKVREGSATFWRTSRFTALAHADIRLRESFAPPLPPLHAQFAPLLEASPELALALQKVTTIAQATLLAPVDPGPGEGCLCVINTHLFFHPYAPHIRTMHTAAILEEAAAFIQRCCGTAQAQQGADGGEAPQPHPALAAVLRGGGRPTVVFAGDLNSDLNDGVPAAAPHVSPSPASASGSPPSTLDPAPHAAPAGGDGMGPAASASPSSAARSAFSAPSDACSVIIPSATATASSSASTADFCAASAAPTATAPAPAASAPVASGPVASGPCTSSASMGSSPLPAPLPPPLPPSLPAMEADAEAAPSPSAPPGSLSLSQKAVKS